MAKQMLVQRIVLTRLLPLLLMATSGCSWVLPGSNHMNALSGDRELVAPEDGALVVFMRPFDGAYLDVVRILDEEGAYLGDATRGSWFAVVRAPGEHLFVASARNGVGVLPAFLRSGAVYYVDLEITGDGVFDGAELAVEFKPIRPGTPRWAERSARLVGLQAYEPNFAAGQGELDDNIGFVRQVMGKAVRALGKLGAGHRLAHRVATNDGV